LCGRLNRRHYTRRRQLPRIEPRIHVTQDVLALLRRVAVERANTNGGRTSVSAVLVDLVRANAADFEREAGR
jgi:hypothetical protein